MQTIVMTGATSGIGAKAIKYLTKDQNTIVLIGAREQNRTVPIGTEILPLNLSSLDSVRSFTESVKRKTDISKAKKELQWQPLSTEEAVIACADSILENKIVT